MNYNLSQTIVETKRMELIEIISSEGCSVYDAIRFSVEEYFMGLPLTDHSYFEFREHFQKRCLQRRTPSGETRYKFGNALTEVLERLFYVQISKNYILIKTFIYDKMKEYEEKEEMWNEEYCISFEDWVNTLTDELHEETPIDYFWNLKKNEDSFKSNTQEVESQQEKGVKREDSIEEKLVKL
jgi:hypothetical protein